MFLPLSSIYASKGIKRHQEVEGGGVVEAVSPSHLYLVGKQSTNCQSSRGDPSWEPSNSLTPGVSAEGDLFQRDTPSTPNLERLYCQRRETHKDTTYS